MFAGLVGEAKAAASGLMLKYVARASVAVPFAIALGFALGLAEQTDTQEVISEATAQAFGQAPFALLGTLAAAPGGAPSLLPVVRLLARNLPLVLPLVIIDALFWRTEPEAQQQTGEMEEVEDEENSAAGLSLRASARERRQTCGQRASHREGPRRSFDPSSAAADQPHRRRARTETRRRRPAHVACRAGG